MFEFIVKKFANFRLKRIFKRYICVKQHDITDCAAACLATISKQYGLKISISKIREVAGTDKQGTNAYGVIKAAEKLGLTAKGVKGNKDSLFSEFPLPAIAHVVVDNSLLHYVVIHYISKTEVIIASLIYTVLGILSSLIRQGQKIKYHFLALPYKEYGELSGTIVNIGTDVKVDQTRGQSFYTVKTSIENKPLYSYKGVKAEVKVGMECEAQVVIKTKKVMYYLLGKINFRGRG